MKARFLRGGPLAGRVEISRKGRSRQIRSFLAAAASHDLRQPLQTLKLLHAALEVAPPQRRSTQNCRWNWAVAGDHGQHLIESLLDVNKLESGNLRPSLSEVSLNEVFFEPLAGSDFVASCARKERSPTVHRPFRNSSSAATDACSWR